MFLSSGLLNEEARRLAFDAVPGFPGLLRNRAIADAFAQPVFLGQLDGMIGGFAREAFSAHADSTYLLVRAAGQVAESRAADIFCEHHDPDGWLDTTEVRDANAEKRLRRSLATIPLEAAATYVDAALNHAANAVVRFAYESGFAGADVKTLGLNVDEPVTEGRGWTSWRRVIARLDELSKRGSDVTRFVLAVALVACAADEDVVKVSDFRDNLVHRGVPVDLDTTAVKRATGWFGGEITVKFRLDEQPEPAVGSTRETIARALRCCSRLADAVHAFVPQLAAHVGMPIEILENGASFTMNLDTKGIALPVQVIFLPTGPKVTVPLHGTVNARPRDQRDHTLFMVPAP